MEGLQAAMLLLLLGPAVCQKPPDWCDLPTIKEVTYKVHAKQIKPGTGLNVRCNEPYKDMKTVIACEGNNTWNGPDPKCELVTCMSVKSPQHGTQNKTGKAGMVSFLNETVSFLNETVSFLNETIHIDCDEGYIYTGTPTRRCQRDGLWSGKLGECKVVECPRPKDLENGQIVNTSLSYLSNITVTCDKGYEYSQPDYVTRQCQANRTWTGQDGVCEVISCPELLVVKHGHTSSTGGFFKGEVTIYCDHGYYLDGPSLITCQADGKWSTVLGRCLRSTNYLPWVITLVGIIAGITIVLAVVVWKQESNRCQKKTGNSEYIAAQYIAEEHIDQV